MGHPQVWNPQLDPSPPGSGSTLAKQQLLWKSFSKVVRVASGVTSATSSPGGLFKEFNNALYHAKKEPFCLHSKQ